MRNKAFKEILASATNESIDRVREFMGRLEEGFKNDLLNRIEALEQRVKRQSELLEQMERDSDELVEMLRPSLDLTNPIQQLHQQIIDEHPLEYGQRFQAIDRDGTAWRFSSEPYIGMSTSNWWNNGGAVWCITDDVQLNGINWRDTLIKL